MKCKCRYSIREVLVVLREIVVPFDLTNKLFLLKTSWEIWMKPTKTRHRNPHVLWHQHPKMPPRQASNNLLWHLCYARRLQSLLNWDIGEALDGSPVTAQHAPHPHLGRRDIWVSLSPTSQLTSHCLLLHLEETSVLLDTVFCSQKIQLTSTSVHSSWKSQRVVLLQKVLWT